MPSRDDAQKSLRDAVADQSGETITVDKATVEAAVSRPSQLALDRAYAFLVPGLLVLSLLALLGMFWLIADGNTATTPDLLLTAFTASLTGLLGLFARSPTAGS